MGFYGNLLIYMVPEAGLEPARSCPRGILSPFNQCPAPSSVVHYIFNNQLVIKISVQRNPLRMGLLQYRIATK